MNYKHVYHAGNFADVVKHVILTTLIDLLVRKDAPLCYIDTHAGTGFYDLYSEHAGKTQEFKNGIEKIIQANNPPAYVKQYLNCVHLINNKLMSSKYSSLQYYPGSPLIARSLLRATDRIVACDLNIEEYQALRKTFIDDKHVAVHHADGFLALKAFLPPPERRGLILIDPPYENPDEFSRIAQSLPTALKRFETGVYAIWYPIKEKTQIERFYRALKQNIKQPTLIIEVTIFPDLPSHLNGCGMAIINPPWKFEESVAHYLPWLWKALSINGEGGFRAELLK